jgi:hypothetical protein
VGFHCDDDNSRYERWALMDALPLKIVNGLVDLAITHDAQ